MLQLPYFQDPRFRRDRIVLVVTFGLAVVLLAGTYFLLSYKHPPSSEKPPAAESANARKGIDEAARLFSAGDVDAARSVLLQVDLGREQSADAWELAGMLEEAAGNRPSALTQYTRGLAIKQSASLYWHRACLLRQQGDFAAALKDMDFAAAAAPDGHHHLKRAPSFDGPGRARRPGGG